VWRGAMNAPTISFISRKLIEDIAQL
jgi:hypothetical protein